MNGTLLFNEYRLSFRDSQILPAVTGGGDAKTSLWCPLVSSHLPAPWCQLVKLSHFFSKRVAI